MTGPPKEPASRFRASTSPTERGVLSAPMSAIDRGRNRVSRFATNTELKAPHGGPSRSRTSPSSHSRAAAESVPILSRAQQPLAQIGAALQEHAEPLREQAFEGGFFASRRVDRDAAAVGLGRHRVERRSHVSNEAAR